MSTGPVRVAEFRATDTTGGGPDKTIFFSAARHDPQRVVIVPFYLVRPGDPLDGIRAFARASGVKPIYVRDRGKFDPLLVPTMRRLLREQRCHILHTHDFKTDFWGPWITRGTPVRLLATAHGWSRPTGLKHRGYNALDFRVLRSYPRVLAVSGHTADRMVIAGADRERITVVPNAIDVDAWCPDGVAPAPGLPPGRKIGTVGRLSIDKDVESLIDAFRVLAVQHDDLSLIVVGDGPLRETLRLRALGWGLGDRVHFLGHRDDLRALYAAFDVFVLASKTEGLPNTLLEAMAMARPIVATPVGGVGEVVRDGTEALYAEPERPATLVTAVGKVLQEPQLGVQLGDRARERVVARYSFSVRVRRMEQIYEDVVEGKVPTAEL